MKDQAKLNTVLDIRDFTSEEASRYQAFIQHLEKTLGSLTEGERALILSTAKIMCTAHTGQIRKFENGLSYYFHTFRVAAKLATVAKPYFKRPRLVLLVTVALLHDVLEDSDISVDDLKIYFKDYADIISAEELVKLIGGLTKPDSMGSTLSEAKLYFRRILSVHPDLLIIKFCDVMDNTLSVHLSSRQKQREKMLENYELLKYFLYYVPHVFLVEYVELITNILYPNIFKRLKAYIAKHSTVLEALKKKLKEELPLINDLRFELKPFDELLSAIKRTKNYGLTDVFLLVSSINSSNLELLVVQYDLKPMPFSWSNRGGYNVYTGVLDGYTFIVHTKTFSYNQFLGINAHTSKKSPISFYLNELYQVNEVEPIDFYQAIRSANYAYTPKGDILFFNTNFTCLDFAFFVHSDLGVRAHGALIDGEHAELDSIVPNGSTVYIHKNEQAYTCTAEWLNMVHTDKARKAIKFYLKNKTR